MVFSNVKKFFLIDYVKTELGLSVLLNGDFFFLDKGWMAPSYLWAVEFSLIFRTPLFLLHPPPGLKRAVIIFLGSSVWTTDHIAGVALAMTFPYPYRLFRHLWFCFNYLFFLVPCKAARPFPFQLNWSKFHPNWNHEFGSNHRCKIPKPTNQLLKVTIFKFLKYAKNLTWIESRAYFELI